MGQLAAFENYQATRHFGSLDGLRCLSILAVIWHHAGANGFPGVTLLQRGGYGVWLFFVISGFLITTLLLREKRKNGFVSMKNFVARRALRIFPLYYTVLLIYMVAVFVMERDSVAGRDFFRNLKFFLSYTSNFFVPWTDGRVIFYFSWSLAVEEQFYLVWPWAEKYLRPAAATVLMTALAAVCFRFGGEPFTAIGLGVLLAHAMDARRTFGWVAKVLGQPFSAPVALASTLGLLAWSGSTLLQVLVAMAALVGAATIREDHWLRPVLAWRPAVRLGQISYGMYLMHMLAYNASKRGLAMVDVSAPLVEFVLTVFVTAMIAQLSFTYYESIFLRMKHRYAS